MFENAITKNDCKSSMEMGKMQTLAERERVITDPGKTGTTEKRIHGKNS